MPDPNPAALDFLLTRRSRPAKTLGLPVPTPEQLTPILTAAARSPDHGKLEPWRFIVFEGIALRRLGDEARACAKTRGLDAEQADKGAQQFETGARTDICGRWRLPSTAKCGAGQWLGGELAVRLAQP